VSTPRVSLVVATYNRPDSAQALLRQLAQQTLPPDEFEALVVDDGSRPPAAGILRALELPFALRVFEQANAGPAAARDAGIRAARGAVVVVVDDDMRLPPEFLAEHLRLHAAGRRVVQGHIRPDPGLARMPLFERFHAEMLERFVAGARAGTLRVRGTHVCTGNVSFPRADYLAVGGFDRAFDRSEDAELGVRLEQAGLEMVFGESAYTVHGSDHTRLDVWLRRAYRYGRNDLRISRKHAALGYVNPWRFLFEMHLLARPLLLLCVLAPTLGGLVARAGMAVSQAVDRLGLRRVAIAGTTVVYGMQYFRGLRDEAGGLGAALLDLRRYRATR
jgi:GT2 family glycosyltransferase